MQRPRIPLWAAVAVPAAAYSIRSIVRGSIAPDLPEDAIVAGALFAVLLAAVCLRSRTQDGSGELPAQMKDRHHHEGSKR